MPVRSRFARMDPRDRSGEDPAWVPGSNVWNWRLRGDHAESRIRSACFGAINNAGRAPPRRATLFLLVPAGVLGRRYPSWPSQITHDAVAHKFPRVHEDNAPQSHEFASTISFLFFFPNLFAHASCRMRSNYSAVSKGNFEHWNKLLKT